MNIEKIKAAALAATQGEWDIVFAGDVSKATIAVDGVSLLTVTYEDDIVFGTIYEETDATHIAAANPSAVLELITLLEETQADLAEADAILIKIAQLLEGVDYRGDYAEGVRVLVTHQAAHIDALKLMFEMPIINDTYNQVRESHDFAIDDIEYDLFSSGWRNAVALVIKAMKENGK